MVLLTGLYEVFLITLGRGGRVRSFLYPHISLIWGTKCVIHKLIRPLLADPLYLAMRESSS